MSNKRWKTIKICLINWTIFVLIMSAFANWLLLKENKELIDKLGICEHNFEIWSSQVESGRIVLELEGEND